MITRIRLALVGTVAALTACAPPRPVDAPLHRGSIPVFKAYKLPGCNYRMVGSVVSEDLDDLREQARMQRGNAIIRLREQTRVVNRSRSQRETARSLVDIVRFYTGTAIRVENAGCFRSPEGTTQVLPDSTG